MNPAISPYPPPFNQRIEEAYRNYSPSDPSSHCCVLGADFFNSTIHFQTEGEVCSAPPDRRPDAPDPTGDRRTDPPRSPPRARAGPVGVQGARVRTVGAALGWGAAMCASNAQARVFQANGKHYQTTPAVNYGPRGGTKPAGFVTIAPGLAVLCCARVRGASEHVADACVRFSSDPCARSCLQQVPGRAAAGAASRSG